ncbi:MAG: hypothetical protein O2856_08500 [Planctomycetota bacterium]|nr:hypothetical protein [Planctomycetota bacterium]
MMVDHLHVSDGGSSATRDRAASSQQIARVSQFDRIHAGSWERNDEVAVVERPQREKKLLRHFGVEVFVHVFFPA